MVCSETMDALRSLRLWIHLRHLTPCRCGSLGNIWIMASRECYVGALGGYRGHRGPLKGLVGFVGNGGFGCPGWSRGLVGYRGICNNCLEASLLCHSYFPWPSSMNLRQQTQSWNPGPLWHIVIVHIISNSEYEEKNNSMCHKYLQNI